MTDDALDLARRWTRDLPASFVARLARSLRGGVAEVVKLRSDTAGPASKRACSIALAVLKAGDGDYLAGLIDGMALVLAREPVVTPVWTGPDAATGPTRLTLAVVNDLVATARQEIVLASFATFPSQSLKDALHQAVDRGVEVTLVLERPADNPHFNGTDDAFPDLAARRLSWPGRVRPAGASLHAKVLVVDRSVALVGSANLTNRAMEDNLECGLLVRGGPLPDQLARHLLSLPALQTVA